MYIGLCFPMVPDLELLKLIISWVKGVSGHSGWAPGWLPDEGWLLEIPTPD